MTNEKIEIIQSVYEYMGKLIDGIEKMIDKFYEGLDKEGCEILSFASEGLEWTIKALELCEDEINTKVELEKLIQIFGEAVNGLENDDYILVADIFSYEVIPVLNDIKKKVHSNL